MLSINKKDFDNIYCIISTSSIKHKHDNLDYVLLCAHIDINSDIRKENTIIIIPDVCRILRCKTKYKDQIDYIKFIDSSLWIKLFLNLRNIKYITKKKWKLLEK
jgi:hypothetical protein